MNEMTYRQLGTSGLTVSVVGLGCNQFGFKLDEQQSEAVAAAALDVGITLFDTAPEYGASEERLGRAIRGHRDEIVIATKFPSPHELGEHPHRQQGPRRRGEGGSRSDVIRSCEGSLRRLGTDYIDLYQMHRPDPATPIEETLSALDDLVRAGKVRYLGNSNFSGWQIADADWMARTHGMTPMIAAQNHYSLLYREAEADVIPACERFGLGMLPYLPLAGGALTGKYVRGEQGPDGARYGKDSKIGSLSARFLTDQNYDVVEVLEKVASDADVSLLHLAMGGLAAQPTVSSVISGATNPDQVRANADAGAWQPSADVLAAIAEATTGPPPRYPIW